MLLPAPPVKNWRILLVLMAASTFGFGEKTLSFNSVITLSRYQFILNYCSKQVAVSRRSVLA